MSYGIGNLYSGLEGLPLDIFRNYVAGDNFSISAFYATKCSIVRTGIQPVTDKMPVPQYSTANTCFFLT